MIRLNNNKITYVALADSNNSIKAPKEIWYADSPNSVKLVYRRKDALIEGVDYEVHDWLVIQHQTESTQATLPIQSNNFNYKYKFYEFGNVGGPATNNNYIYYSKYGKNAIWGNPEQSDVYVGKSYELNTEININCDTNGITMDGELMPNYDSSPYFSNLFIYCKRRGKYASSAITVDGIDRYIPVKLLKSIPSVYDANGIARNAGECGMYDTVNDKFYGNVASSGTFTVADDE